MKVKIILHSIFFLCALLMATKRSYCQDEKLLLTAVIKGEIEIHGTDPLTLIGSCIELKIDTINITDYRFFTDEEYPNYKYIYYKGVLVNTLMLFEMDMINYLKGLEIKSIGAYVMGCVIDQIEKGNCITEAFEPYIKFKLTSYQKYNKEERIIFFPAKVVDSNGNENSRFIGFNNVEYKLHRKVTLNE